jgi:hypothetical protein
MPTAPDKTPLDSKPPVDTKSRAAHSKLRAPEDGVQRRPLASPPSCRAERITLSAAWLQRANPLANNSPMPGTSPKNLEADGHYPPLGGQLHVSAALPPPAIIQMKLRKAPTTVPDSYSVGSSLPSGTPAALRPATAVRVVEILIENARLKFRVNRRKQGLTIKSNRERMALSRSINLDVKSTGCEAGSRKRKASLTSKEVSYIKGGNLNELRPSGLAAHRIRGSKKRRRKSWVSLTEKWHW